MVRCVLNENNLINKEKMNTIELIKDAAFFGGHIPNERLDECRNFFDNVIEKQCNIHIVL
tara:strand:- start:369 stop:548 length:180 start_codon:yes stop_codon:yes gene_type:complete